MKRLIRCNYDIANRQQRTESSHAWKINCPRRFIYVALLSGRHTPAVIRRHRYWYQDAVSWCLNQFVVGGLHLWSDRSLMNTNDIWYHLTIWCCHSAVQCNGCISTLRFGEKICKLRSDLCIGRPDGLMMACSLISKDNL